MAAQSKIDPRLYDYDWFQTFACVGEQGDEHNTAFNHGLAQPTEGVKRWKPKAYKRSDVAEIIAIEDGDRDGPQWIGVFKMRDGRYLFVEAGCDYTGWDCQSGGTGWMSPTLEECVWHGMNDSARDRLAEQLKAAGIQGL